MSTTDPRDVANPSSGRGVVQLPDAATRRTSKVLSAVPTPFDDTGALDLAAFEDMLERLDPHVDSVFVAGTTGEFLALDDGERVQLFATAVQHLGADRVVAHLGHGSLYQALQLRERAWETGVRRFAALSPLFLEADDRATLRFYNELAHEMPTASLYVYLFPERSGNVVSLAATQRILQLPAVAGVKLSGAANDHLDALMASSIHREVYSGNDRMLPHIHLNGGAGVVSGTSCAFPDIFAALRDALAHADADQVAEANDAVAAAVLAVGPSISWLKYALARRSGRTWASRMTLPDVTTERRAIIDALL